MELPPKTPVENTALSPLNRVKNLHIGSARRAKGPGRPAARSSP